jgi:hypothetical protein
MTKGLLRLINTVLLIVCVLSVGHLVWRWNELRPRIVKHAPLECADLIADDAWNLAQICRAVINAKGPLPADPVEAGRAISGNASKLGFTWPNDFKINAAGEICDCAGQPFQILVGRDRVAVSSPSLYAFYFAALTESSPGSHKQ